MGPSSHSTSTSDHILDVAERLAQTRGFNGFSYADIAREVGVTKAALHYHFAGKAELGLALVDRYIRRFATALTELDAEPDGAHRLAGYVGLYRQVLDRDRMCLCGMLAAEHETLPPAMRDAVDDFFRTNEAWLATTLEAGRSDGSLRFGAPAPEMAQAVIAGLEGAMLIARLRHDRQVFDAAARRLVGHLGATTSTGGRR